MKSFPKLSISKGRRQKPRILICTPEVTELPEGLGNAANYIRAKGGGLGDISAGLIRYLYEDDRFQLHVALPKYDTKFAGRAKIEARELDVLTPILGRRGIHLVADSAFSRLDDLYDEVEDQPRVRRAEAFQRHIINYLLDEIRPDVVHCNDWMTGLVPAAARERGIRSLFTIHNVFTEKATPKRVERSGIDVRRFTKWLYFEEFPEDTETNWRKNPIDFVATGIFASDIVNTVSQTFLQEIVDGEFPKIVPDSVRAAIRQKFESGCALGILNAPNDTVDPRVSQHIVPYDVENLIEKKAENKRLFQQKMDLIVDPRAPLFYWPHRLYAQKGPELLLRIARRCIADSGIQIAIVANGDQKMKLAFKNLERDFRGHVSHRAFSDDLSEQGKAASDFMLMPSRYEPCGLPQMECPRFGTIPVARLTGGIVDTVSRLDPEKDRGNGFPFEDYSANALAGAVREALEFYALPNEVRHRNLRRIMRESLDQFSLANTAKEYIHLYETLIGK